MTFDLTQFEKPGNFTINGLEFRCTCGQCPEQYDVYLDSRQVGYVRLRGGELRVDHPDCGGETVLEHEFDDAWQGEFVSAERRHGWLNKASVALLLAAFDPKSQKALEKE